MIRSLTRPAIVLAALVFAHLQPATAQSIAQLPYDKICDKSGKVSQKKLFDQLRSQVDANKFLVAADKNGGEVRLDTAAYTAAWRSSFGLELFAKQLVVEHGRFYEVRINKQLADTINIPLLFSNPASHEIRCVEYGKPPSSVAQARAEVSKKLTTLGSRAILRKDVDNLDKPLASAAPAQFSVLNDRVADNVAFQSQFAVATEISIPIGFDPTNPASVPGAVPLFIMPYARHDGLFNSNRRATDIDNLGFGMAVNMYALPLTGWLSASTSLRGEYLTDTRNEKQIYSGELVVSPHASAAVKWPIELGQRMYFDEIGGGPSIRFDLSGKMRYGYVEDAGGVTTLQANSNFLRLGFASGVDINLGGSDVFNGLSAYATFNWWHNADEATSLRQFYKATAGVRYEFTKNYGLTLGLERGRNEDTLQNTERITAGITIKFGDREQLKEATLQ